MPGRQRRADKNRRRHENSVKVNKHMHGAAKGHMTEREKLNPVLGLYVSKMADVYLCL